MPTNEALGTPGLIEEELYPGVGLLSSVYKWVAFSFGFGNLGQRLIDKANQRFVFQIFLVEYF